MLHEPLLIPHIVAQKQGGHRRAAQWCHGTRAPVALARVATRAVLLRFSPSSSHHPSLSWMWHGCEDSGGGMM
jgi:hypothetical protein